MPLKWKPQHFLGFPFPLSLVSTLHSTFPGKRKNFSWIKNFFFLSPPLPPHFNSDQKTLTSALSFSLFVWFPGNFHFIHFPSLTFLRKFQSLVLPSLSLSKDWMVGMLGSEGGVFSALDLECLERDLGRRFWMEEVDMVPKIWRWRKSNGQWGC